MICITAVKIFPQMRCIFFILEKMRQLKETNETSDYLVPICFGDMSYVINKVQRGTPLITMTKRKEGYDMTTALIIIRVITTTVGLIFGMHNFVY